MFSGLSEEQRAAMIAVAGQWADSAISVDTAREMRRDIIEARAQAFQKALQLMSEIVSEANRR